MQAGSAEFAVLEGAFTTCAALNAVNAVQLQLQLDDGAVAADQAAAQQHLAIRTTDLLLPADLSGHSYSSNEFAASQQHSNMLMSHSQSINKGSSTAMTWDLAALQDRVAAAEAAVTSSTRAGSRLPAIPVWSMQLRQQQALAGQQGAALHHHSQQQAQPPQGCKAHRQPPAQHLSNDENSTAIIAGKTFPAFPPAKQHQLKAPQRAVLQARKPLQPLAVNHQSQHHLQQQPSSAKALELTVLPVKSSAADTLHQQQHSPATRTGPLTCQPAPATLDTTPRDTSLHITSATTGSATTGSATYHRMQHEKAPAAACTTAPVSTDQADRASTVPVAATFSWGLQDRAVVSAAPQQASFVSLLQQQERMVEPAIFNGLLASGFTSSCKAGIPASSSICAAAADIQRHSQTRVRQQDQQWQQEGGGADVGDADSCGSADATWGGDSSRGSSLTAACRQGLETIERLAALDNVKSTLVRTRQALQEHAAGAAVQGPLHPADPLFAAVAASRSTSSTSCHEPDVGGAAAQHAASHCLHRASATPISDSSRSMFQPLTANVPRHQAAAHRLASTPSSIHTNNQHPFSAPAPGTQASVATRSASHRCGSWTTAATCRNSMQDLPAATAAAALAHTSNSYLHGATVLQAIAAAAGASMPSAPATAQSAAAPAAPYHSCIEHTAVPFVRGAPQAAWQAAYAAASTGLQTHNSMAASAGVGASSQTLLQAVAATLQGGTASNTYSMQPALHTAVEAALLAGKPQPLTAVQVTGHPLHVNYAARADFSAADPAAHSAATSCGGSSCGSCDQPSATRSVTSGDAADHHPYMQHWQQRQRCYVPGRPGLLGAASSSSILDPFTNTTMQQQTSSTATSQQHVCGGPAQLQHPVGYMVAAPARTAARSWTGSSAAADVALSRISSSLARQAATAVASLAAAAQARSRSGTPGHPGREAPALEAPAPAMQQPSCSTAEDWLHWQHAAGSLLQGASSRRPIPHGSPAVGMVGASATTTPQLLQGVRNVQHHPLQHQQHQWRQADQRAQQLLAAALAPTTSNSNAEETVRHAADALQRLRQKQAQQAAARTSSTQAAKLAAGPAVPVAPSSAAEQDKQQRQATAADVPAGPAASCESRAPRYAMHSSKLQPPMNRTASQPVVPGTADHVQGLKGSLMQQLQQLMANAKLGSEAAKRAHIAACKAAGQRQVSTASCAVLERLEAAPSDSGELKQQQCSQDAMHAAMAVASGAFPAPLAAAVATATASGATGAALQQLAAGGATAGALAVMPWTLATAAADAATCGSSAQQPAGGFDQAWQLEYDAAAAAAAAAADRGASSCSSSLSLLSHHTCSSQGRLSAMLVSSNGTSSCCSSSSYASAEPHPEDAAAATAAEKEHADMLLPASVLEELLSATAELDSGKTADDQATGGASAAAAAMSVRTAADLAAVATTAMAAVATAAEDAVAPEARQQRPPAPAVLVNNRPKASSTHSAALCSNLADTAQSSLSYALPGHLLLRTPFVGLHADDYDYVEEAIRKYHGRPACKDLVHVTHSRYSAARKAGGARKRLWHAPASV